MNIPESNSQVFQDVFVLALTRKRGGFFVEIGGFHSRKISNTFLLENGFGWGGITVEIDSARASELRENRQSIVIEADATKINWKKVLRRGDVQKAPDYLQVDCEPALSSLAALIRVLIAGIRPRVITFEHDAYAQGTLLRVIPQGRFVRWGSRAILAMTGYLLVAPNVGTRDSKKPFEDWWVRRDVQCPKQAKGTLVTDSAQFLMDSGLYGAYCEFVTAPGSSG